MILRRYHKKKTAEPVVEVEPESVNYSDMKRNELMKVAKDKGFKTSVKLTKDDLIKLIEGDLDGIDHQEYTGD